MRTLLRTRNTKGSAGRSRIKESYGIERIYARGINAIYINRLTGKKTISREDINSLENLGFTITRRRYMYGDSDPRIDSIRDCTNTNPS